MDFAIVDGIQYRHRDGEFNYVVKRELIASVQRRALLAIGNTKPIRPLAPAVRIWISVFRQIVFKDAARAKPGVRFKQTNSKTEDNLISRLRVSCLCQLV